MRRRSATPAVVTAAAVLLAGCAPSAPERMEVLVATMPPGAACIVSRFDQPIATAAPTPAIALVEPSAAPLTIACRRNGFADAVATLVPQLPPPPAFGPVFAAAPAPYEQRVDIALVPR